MAVEVGGVPDAGAVVAVVAAVATAAIVGRRRRKSGYFIRVVTFVQLIASLRDAAKFKSLYRLTYIRLLTTCWFSFVGGDLTGRGRDPPRQCRGDGAEDG